MTTWTNQPESTVPPGFLTKEDGDKLLLETGDKIILDKPNNLVTWNDQIKS